MDVDEVLESPAFWILAGGGIAAELIGYIFGKRAGLPAFPLWQLIFVMLGTVVAAAFFATKD